MRDLWLKIKLLGTVINYFKTALFASIFFFKKGKLLPRWYSISMLFVNVGVPTFQERRNIFDFKSRI